MKETIDKTIQNSNNLLRQKKNKKILGFRTNKIWKKVLSTVYLIFCVLFLVFSIIEERKGQVTTYDYWIDKVSWLVLLLAPFSPYIFLSNTKLRDKLPLFKKHSTGASIGGLLIVFVAFFIICGIVKTAHSSEYKADMKNHAYTVISSKDATCETDGEIKKFCEYCEKETTEIIAKLGHKMTEVAHKESTEEKEGQRINKCSICGKEETIILEKLPHKEEATKSNKTTEKKKESIIEMKTELTTKKIIIDTTTKTTTVTTTKKAPTEPVTEFKWKPAIGNLYNGVELYIVTEENYFLYGVVTEYDTSTHMVQVYLVEAETFMWFPTREASLLNKLKVHPDDPHLPTNQQTIK